MFSAQTDCLNQVGQMRKLFSLPPLARDYLQIDRTVFGISRTLFVPVYVSAVVTCVATHSVKACRSSSPAASRRIADSESSMSASNSNPFIKCQIPHQANRPYSSAFFLSTRAAARSKSLSGFANKSLIAAFASRHQPSRCSRKVGCLQFR
jgi:hypothetical protein